jgi:hypothetical protein
VQLDRRQVRTVTHVGACIFPIAPPAAVSQILSATIRTDARTVARPDLRTLPRSVVTINRIAPLDRRKVGTIMRVGARVSPIVAGASFSGDAIAEVLPAAIGSGDETVARPDLRALPRPVVTIDRIVRV